MHRLLLIIAGAVVLAASFSQAAHSAPDRPVVFIPGILGSKLCDGNTTIWGDTRSFSNFNKLRIESGTSSNNIKSCGPVETINLLGPFWTIHQYDVILSDLRDLGYVEHRNLFVFDYDWRLSNFDNAQALQTFVEHTPQLKDGKFDLIAHSMGGIVARIYIQQNGGALRVRKAIYLGTPFLGSMNALATLSEGWGTIANHLAGGLESIRETILSMPAFYELFPRYASCCRIGTEGSFNAVDILNYDVWQKYQWLPSSFASGPGAIVVKRNFDQAAKLRDLLHDRAISGVQQVIVAGDAFATNFYLYASREDPTWQNWRFSASRGDGTVPVWSAANSLDTLEGTSPSFSEHATIFDDQATKSMLQRELVSNLPPPVKTVDALLRLTTTDGTKNAALLDVKIEPKSVAPGGTARLSIVVGFAEPVNRSEFLPSAELIGPSGAVALRVQETTDEQQRALQRLVFAADIPAPPQEGGWRVNVVFPGQGTHATFFETWGTQ